MIPTQGRYLPLQQCEAPLLLLVYTIQIIGTVLENLIQLTVTVVQYTYKILL